MGVGSLAADVELDALKEAAEGEIVGMKNLLGRYAPLLAALCHNRYCCLKHCALSAYFCLERHLDTARVLLLLLLLS